MSFFTDKGYSSEENLPRNNQQDHILLKEAINKLAEITNAVTPFISTDTFTTPENNYSVNNIRAGKNIYIGALVEFPVSSIVGFVAQINYDTDGVTPLTYNIGQYGSYKGEQGEQGPQGPQGPQGNPGADIFTSFDSLKIDTTDSTVTYTSPTAHITNARLIGYKSGGNEEVECAVDIPIKAGAGVTVDAAEDGKSIEVKSGLYIHLINLMSADGQQYINFSLILNKSEPATNANMVEQLMNYYSNSTDTPIPIFGIIKISPEPKIVTMARSMDGYFSLSGYDLATGNITGIGNFIDLCQSFDTTDKVYPLGGS